MKIKEAFAHQIGTTRLIIEEDLEESDSIAPAVWNGVIIRPDGNFYSSGKEMKVGDKLLVGYVISDTGRDYVNYWEIKDIVEDMPKMTD